MGLSRGSSTVHRAPTMSLVMNSSDFTHILRVLSTNVDGKQKVSFAMTAIKGVGRRFADVCCKKADIDVQKRAGELTHDEVERLVAVIQNPLQSRSRSGCLTTGRTGRMARTAR